MKSTWHVVLAGSMLTLVASLSAAGPEPSKAEREAVIQAAQALFDAMAAHDGAKLRQIMLPEGMLYGADHRKQPVTTKTYTADAFAQLMEQSKDKLLEQMRNPEVRISGDMATLWAPYEFHRNGKFSHCGYDAFQLIRSEGRWRVATIAYTSYATPDSCKAAK